MTQRIKRDILEIPSDPVVAPVRKASEAQGERALKGIMRKAKVEAIKRHSVAMATHAERLKVAIHAGVARRQDLARDW